MQPTPEHQRLDQDSARQAHWKRWGPYLSERQWGTVREDYSDDGTAWDHLPHDHARSRAYRWGEDGLLGFSDRHARLCFSPALWNGQDGILKERLFGLTNPEGNHGEDVKEEYFYLRSTPTHSYSKALYKYPQTQYPYVELVKENRERSEADREFELADTGAFDSGRYFDIAAEYAKDSPNSILIRITATNRGDKTAALHILPQIWFRNTWSWDAPGEDRDPNPTIAIDRPGRLALDHGHLGRFYFEVDPEDGGDGFLFTENETNTRRLTGEPNATPYVKDAFHNAIVHGDDSATNPADTGTKAAAQFNFEIEPGAQRTVRLRLYAADEAPPSFHPFDATFTARIAEHDAFYARELPDAIGDEQREIALQSYAGLLWSKQFYHYVVADWLQGDATGAKNSPARATGRNADWKHLHSRDVISMPDKWEYPWFAAWDLAFQMLPMARVDPAFAKDQLALFLREWYMHPNGQLPAYEFAFGDVNPPVHAWAAWRVYEIDAFKSGEPDIGFLAGIFQKLLINFTWWVNRKDAEGLGIFSGGFLGLDNISVFDRSHGLPVDGELHQADGTGWMALYCAKMMRMAIELALKSDSNQSAYEDMASKFLDHFVQIIHAINTHGGTGLWDEEDGFYYDQIKDGDKITPLKVRSLVGLIPLAGVEIIREVNLKQLPGFAKRFYWFLENQPELAQHIVHEGGEPARYLISAVPPKRLTRILGHLLDEDEFLSPYGIRSMSKHHDENPFVLHAGGREHTAHYTPGESKSGMFGGNSNWRGPVWFPLNHLLIETLESYHEFYGNVLRFRYPSRQEGEHLGLHEVATKLRARLASIFERDTEGDQRPFTDDNPLWALPENRDLILFHEYFHAETGRGLGASHQTGWTALAAMHLEHLAKE